MDTEQLVRALAQGVEPVRPLRRPWRRAAAWAAAILLYVAVLTMWLMPRADLSARMQEPRFVLEQAGGLIVGLAAGLAALASIVPGYRRRVLWLPFGALAIWLAIAATGAWADVRTGRADLLPVQSDWACVGGILLWGVLPGAAMVGMLRRGVPLTPHLTAALGALAAAAIANLGVCLVQPHDSGVIVLAWHCGTVIAVAALGGLAGRRLLGRRALDPELRPG